jgi:hypothetical protein
MTATNVGTDLPNPEGCRSQTNAALWLTPYASESVLTGMPL